MFCPHDPFKSKLRHTASSEITWNALLRQVFPPCFREPNGPPLELFDLDEELSSESRRLAQLANKCTDVDLPYFLLQCGQVLGIEAASGDPKHVIEHVLTRLVEFRKLNQVGRCSCPFRKLESRTNDEAARCTSDWDSPP